MWKKKSIVLSLFAFSVTLEKLDRNPQACPPPCPAPKKIFLHAFFFSPPTRKLAARSLMDEFFSMFSKKDYVGNDDKVGDMLEDIIQSLIK